MKSAIFTASLLASAAVAHRHQHARHHKRQNEVVWVTDIDYVTEIVGQTTTYWVTGSKVTLPPTSTPTHPHAKPSKSSDDAPQFFQPSPEPTTTEAVQPVVVVVSTSSTSTTAPPPAQTPVDTPVDTPAAETPSPTPEPTTLATSTTTPAAAAPAPATSTAAAVSSPSSGGSSSSGGECSEGSPCTGDITYYDAGLGACGITSSNTEHVVALPHAFMGEQSNGNPYCGRTIAITCESTGKTSTATVVDKCMGCDGYSIDLSPAVFDDLASESVGRTTASWYFTS